MAQVTIDIKIVSITSDGGNPGSMRCKFRRAGTHYWQETEVILQKDSTDLLHVGGVYALSIDTKEIID